MQVTFESGQGEFFKSIRADVADYFRRSNLCTSGGRRAKTQAAVLLTLLFGSYIAILLLPAATLWVHLALYGLMGIVFALIGFNLMHDGAHGSFSTSKKLNKLMAYSLNLLGGNAVIWKRKHNINHHMFTNVDGVDDDIELGPMFRLHEAQKKRWYHRFQHLYAIPLYGLSYLLWIYFFDFRKYFRRRVARHAQLTSMTMQEHITFWMSKLLHVLVFLLLPAYCVGVGLALAGYLFAGVLAGIFIAVVFQLAHVVEGAEFELPEADATRVAVDTEWAVHQIRTTANFAPANQFLSWMLGGLNYQMVHHLFPQISHVHYPALREIILQNCSQRDIPYLEFPTFSSAVQSHLRYLRTMGR